MEVVLLSVVQWRVHVVTPYEVVAELSSQFCRAAACSNKLAPLLDSLLLNCILDCRMAWLRPTSIGVACFIVAASDFTADWGRPSAMCPLQRGVYDLARECMVDLAEVDYCIKTLQAGMYAMFEEVEDVDSATEAAGDEEVLCSL